MGDGGKGSSRRPSEISEEQFMQNWELVFGKKKTNPKVILNTNSDKPSDDKHKQEKDRK